MERIILILKNTQGIFNTALNSKHSTLDNMVYQSMRQDRINMNNDMRLFFSDFRKATDEAKINQIHYE